MIQSYQYTLGPAGNREQIDEHDGTTRAYGYDDLYRLTSETITDDLGATVYSKSFLYDPVGNREKQTTVGSGAPGTPTAQGEINYVYDVRDRIETEDQQSYTWDDNGNLKAEPDGSTYEWDFENRLEKVTLADGTVVEHVYDPDGNRVQTTTTPFGGTAEITNFLVDTSGSLSHVVVETDGAGSIVAQYVRGDDLLAVIRPTEMRFFHADGLGSIRRLTDESGLITDGYTYTAFGELLAHTGTDPQPYAFAAEPLDLAVAWQFHRARWMDPAVGRFVGVDPWPIFETEPATIHRYVYAENRPVDRVDPTGLTTIQTVSTAFNVSSTVYSIAVTVLNPEITVGQALVSVSVDIIPGGRLLRAAGRFKTITRLFRVSRRFKGAAASFGRATTGNFQGTFYKAFPSLRQGDVVVHHAVPQVVMTKFPGLITPAELHSLENLRGIPTHLNRSLHLSALRRQWEEFFRLHKNPTKQDLLDWARQVDDLFGEFFIPQWR